MVKVALAARYPTEQAVVELNSLRAKLSVDTRTAVEYLKVGIDVPHLLHATQTRKRLHSSS